MDMNLIRIRETFLKRLTKSFYIGAGYAFDRYYAIRDLLLDLNATPAVVTSHYAYSTALGFNPSGYNTSGPSLNVLWDSRDSTINPYRGIYGAINYQWYPPFSAARRTPRFSPGSSGPTSACLTPSRATSSPCGSCSRRR